VDEQKQNSNIKRRRSRAEVERLVAEYETSGLSRTAFCLKSGLSLSTLARYRSRRQQTTSNAPEAKQWLSVEVRGHEIAAGDGKSSGLSVVLPSGRRIEVGRDFDAGTLSRLLAVVERG
jgi:transposase